VLQAYGPFVTLRREEIPNLSPIVKPDNVEPDVPRARVLSVGHKVEGLKVGDLVIYAGFAFATEGVLLVKADNVLAIVREEES
jgi:co-chaperonin GroES (HSP10)